MIDVTQSSVGIVDAADVLVQIEKEDALAPQAKKYTNICVLATAKAGGAELNGQLITTAAAVENDIEELSELNFTGSIKIWNVALTPEIIKEMQGYAESLVVLSGRTADVAGVDFGDMVVWLTETSDQTSMDDVVKLSNRGVMIDPGKEGKLLYALSHLLSGGSIAYTNQITSTVFTGINDPNIAEALDEAGYSYFFRATDRIWLRGFWIAGMQARSEYADRSVRYDVKQAVAAIVAAGIDFTDATFAVFEARILQVLKKNVFVDRVISVTVPRGQKASDKVRGQVMGVTVRFETANEVRSVYILLGGAV